MLLKLLHKNKARTLAPNVLKITTYRQLKTPGKKDNFSPFSVGLKGAVTDKGKEPGALDKLRRFLGARDKSEDAEAAKAKDRKQEDDTDYSATLNKENEKLD